MRCVYFCHKGSCMMASKFCRGTSVDAKIVYETKCKGMWFQCQNTTVSEPNSVSCKKQELDKKGSDDVNIHQKSKH